MAVLRFCVMTKERGRNNFPKSIGSLLRPRCLDLVRVAGSLELKERAGGVAAGRAPPKPLRSR